MRFLPTFGAGGVSVAALAAFDLTPPSASSPHDAADGQTTALLQLVTNKAGGNWHYHIHLASATSPTDPDVVIAGTGAVVHGSQPNPSAGLQSYIASGLTAETPYRTSFVFVDAQGVKSTVVTADGFTTGTAVPTLNVLAISSPSADRYTDWTTPVSGKTGGSTLTATLPDGTVIPVTSGSLTAALRAYGWNAIDLQETLAGAVGSPKTTRVYAFADEREDHRFAADDFGGAVSGTTQVINSVPEQGGAWGGYDGASTSNTRVVVDNGVGWVYTGTSTQGSHVMSLVPLEADVRVACRLRQLSQISGEYMGPIARASGNTTTVGPNGFSYIGAIYQQGTGWRLTEKIGSVSTSTNNLVPKAPYVNPLPATLDPTQTYWTELVVRGTDVALWVNGVKLIDATTTITTAGKAGFRKGGAANSPTTGLQLSAWQADYIPPLPVSPDIPETLIAPWTPPINTASSAGSQFTRVTEVQPEDDVLVTLAQISNPAGLQRQLKFEDCYRCRIVGIPSNGHEFSIRARKQFALVGCEGDYANTLEKDAVATGCPSNGNGQTNVSGAVADRPHVLGLWNRFTRLHGSDKSHFRIEGTGTGQGPDSGDNVATVVSIQQIQASPRRFEFVLSVDFPVPPRTSAGAISPAKRASVSNNSLEGNSGALQGYNWSYQLDEKVTHDPANNLFVYRGTISQSHGNNEYLWGADTRLIPTATGTPATYPTGTGGQMWAYWDSSYQHPDAWQNEDGRPVGSTTIRHCHFTGTYQIGGNLGDNAAPFKIINTYTKYEAFLPPQDPVATMHWFIKEKAGGGAPNGVIDLWAPQINGRNVKDFAIYNNQMPAHVVSTVNGIQTMTMNAGGAWQGVARNAHPPIDPAPLNRVGANFTGGVYRGKTPIGPGSISDITIAWDTINSGVAQGARIGVIDVVHTTQNEEIDVTFVSHGANAATRVMGWSATSATNDLTIAGKIRKGLRRGTSAFATGASYTFTLRAALRSDPTIFVDRTFTLGPVPA